MNNKLIGGEFLIKEIPLVPFFENVAVENSLSTTGNKLFISHAFFLRKFEHHISNIEYKGVWRAPHVGAPTII